jgi:hypothetical protein
MRVRFVRGGADLGADDVAKLCAEALLWRLRAARGGRRLAARLHRARDGALRGRGEVRRVQLVREEGRDVSS